MRTIEERFWSKVLKSDGCWEWTGAKHRLGYGRLIIGGRLRTKEIKAHRLSWELHNGQIPSGMFVCHHCDNPKCVRIDHLFVGTPLDNNLDCIKKGRNNPSAGEKNGNSKVAISDISEIRRLFINGAPRKEIGKKYNIGRTQVHRIANFESWADGTAA